MRTQLYLTPNDHGRRLTWEEFSTARGQEGHHYELIEGRLEVSPLPDMPHEEVRLWLARLLSRYATQRPDVFNEVRGPVRVFLPEQKEGITAPEPDIACYADFPVTRVFSEMDWRNFSPLLVVEVLSEDTKDKDLGRNRRLYVQVPSIREYWILDTRESFDRPSLIVYRRRGPRWGPRLTVPAGGTYTTALLPGFSVLLDPHAP
jgi:Uma2 family endonuclease